MTEEQTADEQDVRGPRLRAAVERAERRGNFAQRRESAAWWRRFDARFDRIAFAGLNLLLIVFMLLLLFTNPWTGWSWLFLVVTLIYGYLSVWLVPRGARNADVAMAGEFLFDKKTKAERKEYARGTLHQLWWTLGQLAAFMGGVALLAAISAKVA